MFEDYLIITMNVVIPLIFICIYHIIYHSPELFVDTSAINSVHFYGIPGGPSPPNKQDIPQDKKRLGYAYIYDALQKAYKPAKDEDGNVMMLEEMDFGSNYVIEYINKHRMRAGLEELSPEDICQLAKRFGFKCGINNLRRSRPRSGYNITQPAPLVPKEMGALELNGSSEQFLNISFDK